MVIICLKQLSERRVISFDHLADPMVGVFFVKKKNGLQRVIFDARIANCFFAEPARAALPMASAYSRAEWPPGRPAYISQTDLDCVFLSST